MITILIILVIICMIIIFLFSYFNEIINKKPLIPSNQKEAYEHWKYIHSGKETLDLTRSWKGFLTESFGSDLRGTIKNFPFKRKIGVFKLLDYETNKDHDVTKTHWHLLQFENEKPIKECTFKEFLDIYYSVLKPKQNDEYI